MRKNELRALLAEGGVAMNGWLHIPSTWSAELMAHAGWDSLTVDLQHGMHGLEMAIQMLQAISTTDTVPLVRVTWNDPGQIMRMLDAGAYGIICPMINTRAECEAFVGACRYPPLGYRSLGPTRARVYAGADYAEHANDEMLTLAMVETAEAVANIDAIASVPGLDGIFVGTGDLRLSLTGGIGFDSADTQVDAALDTILAACARHDRVPGLFTASADYARQMIARGFRLVTIKTDSMLLSESAQQVIKQTRGE
ncbi:MAG: 2,4-dihydroxyhept-2-ene-1,7-dioic acid aldolase [Chloroflexi bacterium]|nr:2,4-dihydroxyhept-2-ene-1,7-dioic acid aldolase [Chloroflexota bacterium]